MPRLRGIVAKRQAPLLKQYREDPESALVTDRAVTIAADLSDPLHGSVKPSWDKDAHWDYGVHRAVGGLHDRPVPGDILCAALATCFDSTLRMLADQMGVELTRVEVEVTADVDVRGTLRVDRSVPVGFQAMRCKIDVETKEALSEDMMGKLMYLTEQCCVVTQTLRKGVDVEVSHNLQKS